MVTMCSKKGKKTVNDKKKKKQNEGRRAVMGASRGWAGGEGVGGWEEEDGGVV